MKKKYLLLLSLLLILNGSYFGIVKTEKNYVTYAAETINVNDSYANPPKEDSVIALLLNPNIEKAINDYYGQPTQYELYNAIVNEIMETGKDFAFNVTISVPTFHGAHNPPYGLETMTFAVTVGKVKLEKYKHNDVPA